MHFCEFIILKIYVENKNTCLFYRIITILFDSTVSVVYGSSKAEKYFPNPTMPTTLTSTNAKGKHRTAYIRQSSPSACQETSHDGHSQREKNQPLEYSTYINWVRETGLPTKCNLLIIIWHINKSSLFRFSKLTRVKQMSFRISPSNTEPPMLGVFSMLVIFSFKGSINSQTFL